jgi:hypothetical protein
MQIPHINRPYKNLNIKIMYKIPRMSKHAQFNAKKLTAELPLLAQSRQALASVRCE